MALRNFRFLINNKLAGMAHPGLWDELESSLLELKQMGIGAIVSLEEFGLDDEALAKEGFVYQHIPIEDFSTPTLEQADQFVDFVDKQVEQKTAVAAHCMGGVGRTGTLLACYLVAHGHSPEAALQKVLEVSGTGVETHSQENFIHEYASHRRGREAS